MNKGKKLLAKEPHRFGDRLIRQPSFEGLGKAEYSAYSKRTYTKKIR